MTKLGELETQWLHANQSLRMDANMDIFPEERRKFHIVRYEFAKKYCNKKCVLDGACGTGYGSDILGQVASEVIGIDCSMESIEYANKNYSKPHIKFVHSFVESTAFDPSLFDVIVSFETVEHTLCPVSHMMEVARLLKPSNGIALLSIPNNWGLTDHHFLDFNINLLNEVTKPFFSNIELYYQNPISHKKLPGIGLLASADIEDAQCILAVCSGVKKENVVANRQEHIMDEIYKIAFSRHADYLTLSYRYNTNIAKRIVNKLRVIFKKK